MISANGDKDSDDDHVKAFQRMWVNELEAPALLPYASETVGVLCELLENQSAILASLPQTPDSAFISRLCQMEMARLSFQSSSYHRCRLAKICQNAYYYSQYQRGLLSRAEAVFLDAFRGAFEEELRERALDDVPESERLFPQRALMSGSALLGDPIVDSSPEDCRHVAIRVVKECPGMAIDPMAPHETHDLLPNDIVLLQYRMAKGLLLDESAECI